MELRLSPSGPVIGNVGPGFLLRRVTAAIAGTSIPGPLTNLLATDTKLGATGDLVDTLLLENVQRSDSLVYVAKATALFNGQELDTNLMTFAIQFSNDEGTTWVDATRTEQTIYGLISSTECAGMFRMDLETPDIAGADPLAPADPNGDVYFRLVATWAGGFSQLAWAASTVGTRGNTLIVAEEHYQG